MSSTSSPIKNFIVIFGGTFLTLLIGLLTTPIITRLVNPTEYGQLSIFNMYVGIATLVFCLGLDQALVRYYYKNNSQNYHRKLFRYCWLYPSIIWIVFGSIFFLLVKKNIINFEFDNTIALIFVICVLFELLNRIGLLLLRVEYQSSKYSLLNVLCKIVYTTLALVLIKCYNKNELYILTFSITMAYVICVIINMIMKRYIWFGKINNDKDKIEIKELIKFGFPFIISAGITTIFQAIDKISLNHYCSYSEVGIYSSAMSLVNIFAILQSSFNALWAPMATEHYEKEKDDRTFFQKGNAYITILMFGAGLCLILCKDIFAFLLGEKYRYAAYILPCLCFNPIMYTISESTVNGINFAKKSYLHILIGIVACLTNIIGNTFLVPLYGARGAAISTGLSYIVFFWMRTYFSNKCFYVSFKLKQIAFLTIIVFIYSLYNTFVKFNVFTIVGFLLCMLVLLILYKNEIKEGTMIIIEKLQHSFLKMKNKVIRR